MLAIGLGGISMPSICHCKGCTKSATHLPLVNIPPLGYAVEDVEPIKASVGMPMCEEHAQAFRFIRSEQSTAEMVGAIRAMCDMLGKVPPDFDRAFVTPVPLTDPDAIDLMDRIAKAEMQGREDAGLKLN
jgi:hypothetical protein